MVGSHLVISAIATAATLAGCFTYWVYPPAGRIEDDKRPYVTKLASGRPETAASKEVDRYPAESEKAAAAYLETAQTILRRAPTAQASVSVDGIPITERVPLPRKRPIPRP
jgi:hypothetical protein